MAQFDPSNGPVFIRSKDNPEMIFAVKTPAAGSPVTLERLPPSDPWTAVNSQWVLAPIANGLYQIALYSSEYTIFLQAGAAAGDPITIAAPGTTSNQLWKIDLTEIATGGPSADQWLATTEPGLEAGYAGDFPVPGIPLQMERTHDSHDLGDQFNVMPVWPS